MKQVVLASGNAGKLREFQQLLSGCGLEVVPQAEFGVTPPEETGLSFVENAILKARHAASIAGLPAIADDSGIEVDALQGRPGIYSARFSGAHATDEENNRHLLELMQTFAEDERSARYQCLLVFMRHGSDPTPIICQGTWEGRILREARGHGGFGYDPLFLVPSHNCSAAELDKEEKGRISHRAKASRQLLTTLQQL